MKSTRVQRWLCLAAGMALALGGEAAAQTNSTPDVRTSDRDGTVLQPEKLTAPDANTSLSTDGLVPDRPERVQIPPEIQSLLKKFKLEAKSYLQEQERIKKQLEGASDEERAYLRDRLQEFREEWLAQQEEAKDQWQDRKEELKNKLANHQEVFDSLRSEAREQLQDTKDELRDNLQEQHDRRGTE